MPLPPSFLEELRTRLPTSEIVGKRVKLTRAGREFKGLCPFHNEKSPSFTVNDDKQFFHCFGCGAHGDIIGFVMRHDRLSFPEAIEQLAAQAGLQVPRPDPAAREEYDKRKVLGQLLERATRWYQEQLRTPAGREAYQYLSGRGLSDEAIERFRLGYAPGDAQALARALKAENFSETDMLAVGLIKKSEESSGTYSFFRNRVIFPVGDRRGHTVAFGARLLSGDGPKYINSPDHPLFHKGYLLYGLSRARTAIMQNQPIIVCEGYMDVIALVEAGFTGAVAPLGTALTEEQLQQIWKLLPRVEEREPSRDYSPILCFDGDTAGQRAATRAIERALPLLNAAQTVRIAYMPSGEDPDSLIRRTGKSGMQNVVDQAKPLIDAIWELALAGRRLQTPEDKAAFKAVLKSTLDKIANEGMRTLYQEEIRKRLTGIFATAAPPAMQSTQQRRAWGKSTYQAPDPIRTRRLPSAGGDLRERILLATMINHPELFPEYGDHLAHLSFHDPYIEALREKVVDLLSHHETDEMIDSEQFSGIMADQIRMDAAAENLSAALAELLAEPIYVHAGFARKDRPTEMAREGWKDIWTKYLQEHLKEDLKIAQRTYNETPTEENLNRLMALRREAQALESGVLYDPAPDNVPTQHGAKALTGSN